jgi:transcriptional regulator with XRE-family HTH domain
VNVAKQFGDNLVRVRKLADLSQDELSVRASVHRTEISQLERGLRVARIDTLIKLAASLEASPAELLAGIAWEPGDVVMGGFRAESDDRGTNRYPNQYSARP